MVPLMRELTAIWKAHPDWFQYTGKPNNYDRGRLYHLGKELRLKPATKKWTIIAKCQPAQVAGATWTNDGKILSQDESEAAREIIAQFAEHSVIFEEIDSMLQRPALALPAFDRNDLQATSPPHAAELYNLTRALNQRAIAHIRLNNGASAMVDIDRSMTIGKLLRNERLESFLGCQMSTFQFNGAVSVIWEGLRSAAWNADELEHLQGHIDEVDFAPAFLAYLRFVRAFDIEAATSFRARSLHNARIKELNSRSGSTEERGYPFTELFRPQGWRYEALTTRMRNWQLAIFSKDDGTVNFDTVTVKIVTESAALATETESRAGAIQKALQQVAKRVGINYKSAKIEQRLPELGVSSRYLVDGYLFQRANQQRLCSTAIALERFQLERGEYPKSLTDLVPDYLTEPPADLWSSDQLLLRYTIRPGGSPALWSIGENQIDESAHLGEEEFSGDIIWHYEISPDDPYHPDRAAEREAQRAQRRADMQKAATQR